MFVVLIVWSKSYEGMVASSYMLVDMNTKLTWNKTLQFYSLFLKQILTFIAIKFMKIIAAWDKGHEIFDFMK
jgi:hypothetical protein